VTQALSIQYCIYIVTASRNAVLHVGINNDSIGGPREALTIRRGRRYNLLGSSEQREGFFNCPGQSQ